jgi:hypothetical protein
LPVPSAEASISKEPPCCNTTSRCIPTQLSRNQTNGRSTRNTLLISHAGNAVTIAVTCSRNSSRRTMTWWNGTQVRIVTPLRERRISNAQLLVVPPLRVPLGVERNKLHAAVLITDSSQRADPACQVCGDCEPVPGSDEAAIQNEHRDSHAAVMCPAITETDESAGNRIVATLGRPRTRHGDNRVRDKRRRGGLAKPRDLTATPNFPDGPRLGSEGFGGKGSPEARE